MSSEMKKSKLLVLSAPSGAGKSTLANMILQKYGVPPEGQVTAERRFSISISFTTRAPRGQERHGTHYFFISEQEFLQKLSEGEFLEFAKVFNKYYYGTSDRKSVV